MPKRRDETFRAPKDVIRSLLSLAGSAGAPVDRVVRVLLDEFERRLPDDMRQRLEREYRRQRMSRNVH